jgi:UPF0755 protein
MEGRISKYRPVRHEKNLWLMPVIVIGCILVFLAIFILFANKTIHAPNRGAAEKKNFIILQGQGSGDIATQLKKEKLISNRFVFILYLNYKGLGDEVQAGQYQIAGNLKMTDVAGIITTGKIVTNKITIPEGWTNEKIAVSIAENTKISKNDFLKAAVYKPERDKYSFLSGLKEGDSLEGFLYPDTYQISLTPTADEIVEKMLKNFNKKLTDADRAKIKSSGLSTYEVVTLASVVEREVAKADDRKLVASVFLNRLNADMPLESCATVQYILNSNKTIFSYEETRTPSPYNTYVNAGLPKGPIGNPSIDSIRAVIYPEKSNYFYFLSASGVTYFSKTLDEHNAKKYQYLK